jgi:hypothetical protein
MEEKLNITLDGSELNVRHGNLPDLPKIFQYEGFRHHVSSAQGFVDLVKAKSNKPNCVVFWKGDGSIRAIVDDTVYDREQDAVTYAPRKTIAHDEWTNVLHKGVRFSQKDFIEFLKNRPDGELAGRDELLLKARKFTYATQSGGEALRDDNNNYSFALKVNNVETTVQMPATVSLNIALFDEEPLLIQRVELDLRVNIPRKEGESLSFELSCPIFERYLRDALMEIIDIVKAGLDGYLVVRG